MTTHLLKGSKAISEDRFCFEGNQGDRCWGTFLKDGRPKCTRKILPVAIHEQGRPKPIAKQRLKTLKIDGAGCEKRLETIVLGNFLKGTVYLSLNRIFGILQRLEI